MKLALFLLAAAICTVGQQGTSTIVLDPSLAYVYLKFDHSSSASPQQTEGGSKLWLKIVNNSRVPILVPTSGSGSGGVGVLYDVVPNNITTSTSSGIDTIPISGDTTVPAKEKRPKEELRQGISSEVSSLTRVQPGKDLMFDVPAYDIDDQIIRVRFKLDVGASQLISEPWSYVDFLSSQIPTNVVKH